MKLPAATDMGPFVVHKSSAYSDEERRGFEAAADERQIHSIELIWFRDRQGIRLFRRSDYPPLRGTLLSLGEQRHVLYTRGSVPFYGTYPGMYIPSPLAVDLVSTERSPVELAEEILSLTKMNWNQTQFDGRDPITLRTSRAVGRILKYVPEGAPVAARYANYM